MVSRRELLSMAAATLAVPRLASAQSPASGKVALYANVGADLTHYDVDVDGMALTPRESVKLPASVQYAWPHASRRYLYVASSNSQPGTGPTGTEHHVTAFAIDPATGALKKHGEAIRLPVRPIHMSTDIPSENILVAFNNPSSVRVYRINKDFTPGEEVPQPGVTDAGIYAHQVRVTPDNQLAILVTRGNEGTPAKPEDPGALKVFDYKDGVLSNEVSVAPNGGKEFGPRHLDFHPTKPWVYVSIETQNQMMMFPIENGRLAPNPAFVAGTLAEPNNIRARQAAEHRACPPERPLRVRRQPGRADRGLSGAESLQGRRERHRRVRDRPGDRRAEADSEHRDPRHPPAHVPHRPERPHAGRASTICRSRCATAIRSRPSWPGCRCCGSATTASSNSSANTTSMSATRRCGGWGWCRCRRSAAVAEGARGGLTSPGARATRLARCR